MLKINFDLIISDAIKAPGTKTVFGSMQEAYRKMAKSLIIGRVGIYDATKFYVFGDASAKFYDIPGNNVYEAGAEDVAFFDGEFYTITPDVVCNNTGSKLEILLVQTPVVFSDGVGREFITNRTIVQDNASGTITANNIVPLFLTDNIVTDWIPLNMAADWSGQVYVKRVGQRLWLAGTANSTGSGDSVCGQFPDICRARTNYALKLYRVISDGTTPSLPEYQTTINNLVGNAGSSYIFTGTYIDLPEYIDSVA